MEAKYLNSQEFLCILKNQKRKFFALDYDGTLTPIVKNPDEAILTNDQKRVLNGLQALPDVNVSIVSGRSLSNLKFLLDGGLDSEILLMGTHGAEIGEEIKDTSYKKDLLEIKNFFSNEPDLLFEEKTLSLAIHYKSHPNPENIKTKLNLEAKKYENIFRVQEGHDVFEFLPKQINKGLAVDYLAKEFPDYYLIYFGDDLTDNYAFKRINALGGLSIQVGERLKERVAKYLIKDVQDTYQLISSIF